MKWAKKNRKVFFIMPRINIEEKWWSDPRRMKLGQLLSNPYLTESVVVNAWRLSQEYWEKGLLIPGHIYVNLVGSHELLLANLACLHESQDPDSLKLPTPISHISLPAEHNPNTFRTHMNTIEQASIYLRGSREYLSWGMEIRQKRVLAGQKSAEKRRLLYGSAQPKSNTHRTHIEQIRTSSNSPAPVPAPVPVPVPKKKKNTIVGIRTNYPREFESLWEAYGKRGDKKAAFDRFKELNPTEQEIEQLSQSIHAYVRNNPELKYRKHFERFLKTDWREVSAEVQMGNGKINWEAFDARTKEVGNG